MNRAQTELIRTHLEQGHELTAMEALDRFRCFRLAARVNDLRRDGWDIHSRMTTRNGKRFAVYWMDIHDQYELSL